MAKLSPFARARGFLAPARPTLEAKVAASLALKGSCVFAAIARLRARGLPKASGFGKFHGDRD